MEEEGTVRSATPQSSSRKRDGDKMPIGGDDSTTMGVGGMLHCGWGKVKIAAARWVLGDAVLLVSKEVAARNNFVACPGRGSGGGGCRRCPARHPW
jgi:hypothetical protein